MTSFYSPSTNGIYQSTSYDDTAPKNGLVPADSVLITDDLHDQLIANLQAGGTTSYTAGSLPIPVPQSDAQKLLIAQQNQIAILTDAYTAARTASVSYKTVSGVTAQFQGDVTSINNLESVLLGFSANPSGVPVGFYWVAEDNSQVPFTYADMQGLANAFVLQGAVAFQNLQNKKTAVKTATSIADVQAVTF